MNQLLREKVETKLEKIARLAKHQNDVLSKRGDVARDVRSTLEQTQILVAEVKELIKIGDMQFVVYDHNKKAIATKKIA